MAVSGTDLALIDTARRALAEARDLGDVKDVRDRAITIQRYLSRKEGAEEAAGYANEIRLRAERRIGELLAELGEMRGNPGKMSQRATLPDGVTRSDSSRYQRIGTNIPHAPRGEVTRG